MNLHDWIDELSDVLDVEVEVDEALVSDLVAIAAENVGPRAAPVTAYLLGVAVGSGTSDPEAIERLAADAQALAESWDRPANGPDVVDDAEVAVPDDAAVDHTLDEYADGIDSRE